MRSKIAGILLALSCLSFTFLQIPDKRTPNQVAPETSILRGKKVYTNVCLACHMADGGGVQNMNPPLSKTTYVLGDKTTLIGIVLNGFDEDVEINGKSYSNTMTPHRELKDQEIADVLTYVRSSFGNKADAITAAEVTQVRATHKE